ncbi:MAG: hypothetical protein LBT89_05670, partial [Planctomycetaceae bacterium]|nr:hypothetical protein [Planctomycetaceae bacterium]
MSGPKGGSVNLVSALLDLAALATAESDWQTVLRTSRTDISSMNSAQASAAACVKSGATDEVSKKYAEGEFGLREAERLQKEAQNARNRVSASSSTSRQT